MLTRYDEEDDEYKILAAGAQRYWHGTRAAFDQVKDNIPNNTMICITDDNDAPYDTGPIGSVVDYEGSTAPEGYLFCDGSTFDRTEYPDLYLFLGTDKLPEKYSEYGTPQTITKNTTFTAEHDGILYGGHIGVPTGNIGYITVNGIPYSTYGYYPGATYNVGHGLYARFKKGDTVTTVMSDDPYVQYLNQKPKIIKAVSNMSVSDASALMAQIIQHMTLDYANATTITTLPFTAPQRGMLFLSAGAFSGGDGSRTFYIDGVQVGWFGRASATVRTTLTFPIDKDQVFTSDYGIWGTYRFVPYK